MIDLFKRDEGGKLLPVWNVAERGDFAAPVVIHEWIEGARVDVGAAPSGVIWERFGERPKMPLDVTRTEDAMLVKALANWVDGMGQHVPGPDDEPVEFVPPGSYTLIGPGVRGNPYNIALPLLIRWDVEFTPLMERMPRLADGAPDTSAEAWFAFLRQDVPRCPVKGIVVTSALGKLLGGVSRVDLGAAWPLVEPLGVPVPAAPPAEGGENEAKP